MLPKEHSYEKEQPLLFLYYTLSIFFLDRVINGIMQILKNKIWSQRDLQAPKNGVSVILGPVRDPKYCVVTFQCERELVTQLLLRLIHKHYLVLGPLLGLVVVPRTVHFSSLEGLQFI